MSKTANVLDNVRRYLHQMKQKIDNVRIKIKRTRKRRVKLFLDPLLNYQLTQICRDFDMSKGDTVKGWYQATCKWIDSIKQAIKDVGLDVLNDEAKSYAMESMEQFEDYFEMSFRDYLAMSSGNDYLIAIIDKYYLN